MPARFLAPELTEDDTFALPVDESQHASRVLRLQTGDEILVFDGRGRQVRASVERIGRGAVLVRPLGRAQAAPEPAVALTLFQSVIKVPAMDEVVRNATMMGVARLQPIVSTHSTVTLDLVARRRSVDRWQRVAVAATKQCGRAVVPEVMSPLAFEPGLQAAADVASTRVLLVEPAARCPTARPARSLSEAEPPTSAVVAVGPEGGWTEAEVSAAEASGFVALTLGERILRADVVSLAAIAVLQFIWGDL